MSAMPPDQDRALFAGLLSKSRRGKSQTPRSLDSRVEGDRDSEAYRQSHRMDGERVTGP
jgi:hypothetical protein